MATIAIVGAGLALISRDRRRMDHLVLGLGAEGLTARGSAANGDPASLTSALDRASRALGPIEVLPYSPLPLKESLRPVLGPRRPTRPPPGALGMTMVADGAVTVCCLGGERLSSS